MKLKAIKNKKDFPIIIKPILEKKNKFINEEIL